MIDSKDLWSDALDTISSDTDTEGCTFDTKSCGVLVAVLSWTADVADKMIDVNDSEKEDAVDIVVVSSNSEVVEESGVFEIVVMAVDVCSAVV